MKTWHILIAGLIAVALWVASAIIVVYVLPLCGWEQRAQFGDMFGAVSALFSGLAFAGIILTILLQRDELRLQREDLALTRNELKGQKEQMEGQKEQLRIQNETLKKQQFETTFFQLLQAFNDVVQNTAWYDGDSQTARCYKGKEAFKYIRRDWESHHKSKILIAPASADLNNQEHADVIRESINREWLVFYSRNAHNLGHYYRTLFHLIKFIHNAPEGIEKIFHANIVRALLSDHEQALLFYNLLSEYGGDEFPKIALEYRLLKHVRDELLFDSNHRKLFPPEIFKDR